MSRLLTAIGVTVLITLAYIAGVLGGSAVIEEERRERDRLMREQVRALRQREVPL